VCVKIQNLKSKKKWAVEPISYLLPLSGL
jgi:hypothetical protein